MRIQATGLVQKQMRMWLKKTEWMSYANCLDDVRFISETSEFDNELREVCNACKVRPECLAWAADDEVSAVFVCGVRFPDPAYKRALRQLHQYARSAIPGELRKRGEDV